jgi:imidazole glycerol-phosphate synthase subunit HisH
MIAIIDYGAGNLRSVQKALEHLGAKARLTASALELRQADKIILPGVGAFGHAVEALDRLELREPIAAVIAQGVPFLGICLGMQLLFEHSEESLHAAGLAIFKGAVRRFPPGLKVPHLGWNEVQQAGNSTLWHEIPDQSYFYFAHSYYVEPADPALVTGVSDYGMAIPASIQAGQIYGVQFHPEKSQSSGLQLLKNFISL